MIKKLWQEYKSYIISFASVGAIVIIMWMLNIPCPIKAVFGISCAGCGMSRAIISALSLDFAAAFAYHPLWLILPLSLLSIVILSIKEKTKAASAVIYCMLALFLAVWIIRIIANDPIVSPDIENSVIGKVIRHAS